MRLTLTEQSPDGLVEIVDGRTIRHLSVDGYYDAPWRGETVVVLIDGHGRSYQADPAEWERVRHLSIYCGGRSS